MKLRNRVLIWSAILGIAGSLLLPASFVIPAVAETAEQITSQVDMDNAIKADIEYGYDNAAKAGRSIPLRISLENSKEELFSGVVKVLSRESNYEIYHYQFELEVQGKQEETFWFNIPLGYESEQIYVELNDNQGNELIRAQIKPEINTEVGELFIGVLSDNPQKLSYLNQLDMMHGMIQTRAISFTGKDIPEDEYGLDLLDILLITNYDTSNLTPLQTEAIWNWVQSGGTLLIGTGARGAETISAFSEKLPIEQIGYQEKEVDMGVEYATNGPGDSFINLICSDFILEGGTDVLSNDEFPVLTSVYQGDGIIGVAAYDFSDIEIFCKTHRTYPGKLFQTLMGENRLTVFYNIPYSGIGNMSYWEIQGIINSGDVARLPRLPLYALVIFVYIILAGPGLYLFLKKQQRRRYYQRFMIASAVVFSLIIWSMGINTRFKDTFITYATIKDVSEFAVDETTYINVRTPYNQGYQVSLNPQYRVEPILKNNYDPSQQTRFKFTGEEDFSVRLGFTNDNTQITVKDTQAFASRYFSLKNNIKTEGNLGFSGNITFFNGKVTGLVENKFPYPIEDAAVFLYGRLILLGDLEPGEKKQLSGLPVLNLPTDNTYLVAAYVTGTDQYQEPDINDKNYILSLSRTNLLSFYLISHSQIYKKEAKVIGFSREQSENKFLSGNIFETYGQTILTSSVEVNTREGEMVYRPSLIKSPVVISGEYYETDNTAYSADPVVLEYSLGNDIEVESLTFEALNPELIVKNNGADLSLFSGGIYFYNHNTGIYDQMDDKQDTFSGEQLEPYLSPGNTIIIKYVNESRPSYNWYVTLPKLTVTGRDK